MKKAISCTIISTIIGTQVPANANAHSSRADGIGETAILQGQQNLRHLKIQLSALDKELEKTEAMIKSRQDSTELKSANIVATGLGVALASYAFLSFNKTNATGNPVVGAMTGIAALSTSALSVLLGGADKLFESKLETEKVQTDLKKLKSTVQIAIEKSDSKVNRVYLSSMDEQLESALKEIERYTVSQSSNSGLRLKAILAQASGLALTLYGMNAKQPMIINAGAVVLSAGNLSQLWGQLSEEESQQILKEVQNTRHVIKTTTKIIN